MTSERTAFQLFGAAQAGTLGLHLMLNPAGTWSFVGNVPTALCYTMRDGSPVSEELAQKIIRFGAGLFRKDVAVLTWKTKEEAEAAAKSLGYSLVA